MRKLGIGVPMLVLCAMLLLLAPQVASAGTHWHFYAGVTPTYTYVQPYPNYYYTTSPYYYTTSPYYYTSPYSAYYYMYPRHEWSYYYRMRGHRRHWR